ncbi:MAG: histidine phosphatase family protein [Acidimicrobiales bacterium]
MELLLIRHALPLRVEVAEGEVADPPLAPRGHEQAEALAGVLVEEDIGLLYASPMCRARQTAAHVAERLGLDVRIDPDLAEFDRQSHFYVPIEELRREGGDRWDDLVAGRWGPGGEADPATFKAVVVDAFERIVVANPGRRVAVICHGGVINAYLSHVIGARDLMFFEPAYAGISRLLASSAGKRQIKSINEHAHVRALL